MYCRTVGLPDYWTVRLSGCRIIDLTPCQTTLRNMNGQRKIKKTLR